MFKDSIPGLDKVFRNDIERPKVILVTGPPGSMKTTFCYTLMSHYLRDKNEFGLYTTLEESVDSHLKNMESIGAKLSMKMQISDLTDLREIGQIDEVIGEDAQTDYVLFIEKMIQRFRKTHGDKFSVFVLDSLGALYSLMEDVKDMRKKMFYFFKMLRDNDLTCFIIMERSLTGESQLLGNEGFHAGKWHVTGAPKPVADGGFDRSYWFQDWDRYFSPSQHFEDDVQLPPVSPDGGYYATTAFADRAIGFLKDHAQQNVEQPFFLYLAFISPHFPLHVPPEEVDKYRGKYMMGWDELRRQRHERMIQMGIVKKEWPLTLRDERVQAWKEGGDKAFRDLSMAVYAAQIDRMDQSIGRLLRRLDETGASENTLVLFLADNGGCAEEINRGAPGVGPGGRDSYWSYGLPWANASNTPFRLYKHWVHEGGISTPLIASWPGRIAAPSSITNQPGHLIDLMATCVDVAGARYPQTFNGQAVTPLEGKSLRPILEGRERQPHEAIYWEHEGNRAVRQGRWKLVSRYEGGNAWELYDIDADRSELNNLSGGNPAKVRELSGLWDAWAARVGVQPWDQVKPRQKTL